MSGILSIRTLRGVAYHGLVLLLLIAGLTAIFLSRDLLYFRDFAILYDGAARMGSGQSPFRDFGMPTGPVSLFVPALAMHWFGPSWQVFQLSQMLINALILLSVTVLLVQLAERRPVILASQLVLTFSYLILLTHPWYNTTALLLFFITLNLSVAGGAVFACLAGFTTVLCLFTKQDFGGLALISALACLGFRHFVLQRSLQILLVRLGCYWLGLAAGLALFYGLYAPGHLAYWFNAGQAPHPARTPHFEGGWTYVTLASGLYLIVLSFMDKKLSVLVYGLVLVVAVMTASLSGLNFSHYYAGFVVPPVAWYLYGRFGIPAALVAAVIGGLLVLQPPVKHSYRIFKAMAANRIERTNGQSVSSARHDLVPLASCTGRPSNVHVPASSCVLIDDLLALQKDNRIPSSGTILNTSELTPVNALLGYHTAIGNPLWYDARTVLFERERQRIAQEVDQGLYDLVLLQGVHGGMTGFHRDLLERLVAADGYRRLNDGYAGPSAVPKCRRKDGSCTIHVFIRQPGD